MKEVLELHDGACDSSIEAFKRDLQKLRTGRANAAILDSVMVDYYGTKTALTHLGQISSPEPRLIVVQVYDNNAVESVIKALRTSDHGFNPSRDGNTLRISVATLTEETRRDIVKTLHKMAEEIRVSVRNHRRDANEEIKKLEKEGELTKDDVKRALELIQKQTDGHIARVDEMLRAKEVEVMEV
jgi:ribosome recycling factor